MHTDLNTQTYIILREHQWLSWKEWGDLQNMHGSCWTYIRSRKWRNLCLNSGRCQRGFLPHRLRITAASCHSNVENIPGIINRIIFLSFFFTYRLLFVCRRRRASQHSFLWRWEKLSLHDSNPCQRARRRYRSFNLSPLCPKQWVASASRKSSGSTRLPRTQNKKESPWLNCI